MEDPFALIIEDERESFEALIDRPIELELVGYTDLRERILLNAFEMHSAFDIIAIDMSWAAEASEAGVVAPLDHLIEEHGISKGAYLAPAIEGAQVNGATVGLPVQPHAELLLYHRDLLDTAGLDAPRTTDDVLSVARALHNEDTGLAGLCWNGERGSPLGQTMLHLLAAFGGRPLTETGAPTLDTPQMVSAIGFAQSLTSVSPPGIADMALDERITAFAGRRCAMTYAWTGRWLLLERTGLKNPALNVGVAPAPHAPGVPPVSPLGVWLLAIPSNLEASKVPGAFQALAGLTSLSANRILVEKGVGTLVHPALLEDASLVSLHPALDVLGRLEHSGALQSWMRPAIPQFQALTEILGSEVHDVLTGLKTAQEAATRSQEKFNAILDQETGR